MPVITNYAKITHSLGKQHELLDSNWPPFVTELRETSLRNTGSPSHSKKREKTSTVLPFAYLNAMCCGARAHASACPSPYLSFDPHGGRRMEHIRALLCRSLALKLDKSTSFPPCPSVRPVHEMRAAKRLLGQRAERSWVTGLRSQRAGSWRGLGEGTENPASALG